MGLKEREGAGSGEFTGSWPRREERGPSLVKLKMSRYFLFGFPGIGLSRAKN